VAGRAFPYFTPDQYLDYDEQSPERNEYFYGEILPVEAASVEHGVIAANVVGLLFNDLNGTPCRIISGGPRIAAVRDSVYVYPDVSVACGELEYFENSRRTVTNPKVVFVILSPSTMKNDLGPKARLYWDIKSLTDLIFIDQSRIWIEQWHKTDEDDWRRTRIEDAGAVLKIESIQFEVPLSKLYDGVRLWPRFE
jgi:Uma2 family endonuclease